MTDTKALLKYLDRFEGTEILVVGDVIVDHYVWGKVNRISPEAPVVVVEVTREEKRLGGAGLVARNLTTLGANVTLCGISGNDDASKELQELLDSSGIRREGIVADPSRRTTLKTRVIAHKQQVVRIDKEDVGYVSADISKEMQTRIERLLPQKKGVIVSDYAKGAVTKSLFDYLETKTKAGILGAKKIPLLVDPKAPNFSLYKGATIIKPNRSEAESATHTSIKSRADAIAAGRQLLEQWGSEMVLITLGEDGMVLVSKVEGHEPAIEIDTVARDVFDVTGAGDTVSAVFTLSMAVGASPREAATLANFAAGIVVAEVGTVAVSRDELREALLEAE